MWGLVSMAADFGKATSAKVHTDSTAALGMVFRSGLGRTRHARVQYLWIQQKVQDKELVVEKVDTKENVADLMTKSLSAEVRIVFHGETWHLPGGWSIKFDVGDRADDKW